MFKSRNEKIDEVVKRSTMKDSVSRPKSITKPTASSKSIVIASTKASVKESTRLDPSKLYGIPLFPVDCSFGAIDEKKERTAPLDVVVRRERKLNECDMTILFAIRRPGCGSCRGHGRVLTKLAEEMNVSLVGAIKETNVDNDALIEFYKEYFHQPIYKDENWNIFKALGGRKIGLFHILKTAPIMARKYARTGVKNIPFGGDIWTQGGVMIFDRKSNLRYVYYENYGEDINVEEMKQVINHIRSAASTEGSASKSTTATPLINLDEMKQLINDVSSPSSADSKSTGESTGSESSSSQ